MKEKKPFFAQFLENQDREDMDTVKGGGGPTMKYPSDNDEEV